MRLPVRECTSTFDFTDLSSEQMAWAANNWFGEYKILLIMGLAKSGKTTLMSAIEPIDAMRIMGKWSRSTVINMLGKYEPKYNGPMQRLEDELFADFIRKDWSVLCIESFGRKLSDRKRILKIASAFPCAVVVLDGQPTWLANRLKTSINAGDNSWGMLDSEVSLWMRDQWFSTSWPTFEEGWKSIFYVNTFGEAGNDWLRLTTKNV